MTTPIVRVAHVEKSAWSGPNPWEHKRLLKIKHAVEENRLVWWGRRSFSKEPFREVTPKMHLFVSRTANPDQAYSYIWSSLCDYSLNVSEALYGIPRVLTGAPPKKAERCVKCEKKLSEIKKEARISAKSSQKTTADAIIEEGASS